MTEADIGWAADVASRTGLDTNTVLQTFSRYNIPGHRPIIARRRLRLEGVHFAGVKNVAVSDGSLDRESVPFSFTHRYEHLLTAFATVSRNDAGKTSVVNVTEWGLRGSSGGLQADIQSWLRQAIVGFTIAEERLLVAWTVEQGVPSGVVLHLPAAVQFDWDNADSRALSAVTAAATTIDDVVAQLTAEGAEPLGLFSRADEFQAVMSDVMGPRIGFEQYSAWQKPSKSIDDDDGTLAPQGWPLWSQGLVISDPEKAVVLGETTHATVAVLSMYLGTGWGASASAAAAQVKVIRGRLAGVNRRRARDHEARKDNSAELTGRLATLSTELEQLPDSDSFAQIDRDLHRTRQLGAALETAERELAKAETLHLNFAQQLARVNAELAALREAALTSRFWHSLTPTCCPRCDAQVSQEQLRREAAGNCSLCNSELQEGPTETSDADDSDDADDASEDDDAEPDSLTATELRHQTLQMELQHAAAAQRDAEARRGHAQAEYTDAARTEPTSSGSLRRRREIELEIATVTGRLEERLTETPETQEVEALREDLRVLEAAQAVVNRWKLDDQAELLREVSDQITHVARRLGVSQLESVALKSNANLSITKGGETTTFTKVNAGEQLRFKIAVVVALLRVGGIAGVSRHPGVLFIDSFAREEMSAENAVSVLQSLQEVAQEFGIQVITSSANGALLRDVLPEGAVRMSTAVDDFMW
ncbi:hypothetical protein [Curtobacterium sp. C2H10]|uniref:hypothetical protein n=1 Tax=Curtobacterium sp. C2H10 TaxID=2736664 RepID=UPI0021BEFBA0|nr:hypothetical protein [Curtobacterium sp. C2H10]MCT9620518.1 hypothetical protein [Curtobacterium sp. C2H10]